MKAGDTIEKTYTTSQIAKIIGVHPNTVRMYEGLGLIPKPLCKTNGYRVFSDVHIYQFRIVRIVFQIEVLQSGMRKRIVEVVKLSAKGLYDDAITLTKAYIDIAQSEIKNANEAVEITNTLLKSTFQEKATLLKRKEVLEALGITMDTLRNWEMNGLLKIKRKENGYRVYDNEDIVFVCDKFILGWILVMVSMFSIGVMVGDIAKNSKVAGIIESLLYFPMLIFSGATLPYEVMPTTMQKVVDILPLTQGIKILKSATLDLPMNNVLLPIIAMVVIALICSFVAIGFFKWE